MDEHAVIVCLTVGTFFACGQAQTSGRLQATLDQCTSYLAATACDRYTACEGHKDIGAFSNRDVCEKDYKQRAARLWPQEACDGARVDELRFENCLSAVLRQRCTKDPWDMVRIEECAPSYVCSGSPPSDTPPEPVPTL